MKEYQIKNYVDDKGNRPILVWLNSLDKNTQKRVLQRLDRLYDGNFGDYKQLNSDLYELRLSFGAGYRIYYTIQNNIIILLINGGDKKSQVKDIKLANDIIEKLKDTNND